MKINSFEDIEVWKRARVFAVKVYSICRILDKNKEFSLSDQMKRSAISIMANIAEGFTRKTNKEFVQFLFIAKGSAAELQNYFYLLIDLKFIDNDMFLKLREESIIIQKMLSNFIKYLKKSLIY